MARIHFVILMMLLALPAVAQQQSIDWWVIGSGFVSANDTSYHLVSTEGQPVIESEANSFNTYTQGFWHPDFFTLGTEEIDNSFRKDIVSVYPNPTQNYVSVKLTLQSGSRVMVSVYDLLGTKLIVVFDNMLFPGNHEIAWDGTNNSGASLPTGLYICETRICPAGSDECRTTQTKLIIMK